MASQKLAVAGLFLKGVYHSHIHIHKKYNALKEAAACGQDATEAEAENSEWRRPRRPLLALKPGPEVRGQLLYASMYRGIRHVGLCICKC